MKAYQKFLNLLLRPKMASSTISATRCHTVTIFWVCLVSFAATTLCIVSQWAIIWCVPSVICNASSEGKKHVLSFASNSVKLHSKCWRWSLCLPLQPNSNPLSRDTHPLHACRKQGKSCQTLVTDGDSTYNKKICSFS
jgi:hypothetical protein